MKLCGIAIKGITNETRTDRGRHRSIFYFHERRNSFRRMIEITNINRPRVFFSGERWDVDHGRNQRHTCNRWDWFERRACSDAENRKGLIAAAGPRLRWKFLLRDPWLACRDYQATGTGTEVPLLFRKRFVSRGMRTLDTPFARRGYLGGISKRENTANSAKEHSKLLDRRIPFDSMLPSLLPTYPSKTNVGILENRTRISEVVLATYNFIRTARDRYIPPSFVLDFKV